MPIWTSYTPEPPEEVVARLKQIDPHLNLKFVELPATEDYHDGVRWWGLVLEWEENDPRHAMVARGLLAPMAFDILGYLPLDCSVHEAFNYVQNFMLQRKTEPRIDKLVNRLGEYNKTQTNKNTEPTQELASELIETNAKTLFREEGKHIPKVYQSGPKK